jgi:hypothetical protein
LVLFFNKELLPYFCTETITAPLRIASTGGATHTWFRPACLAL